MNEHIHILAVDDEADIREIVRILLESKGYTVASVASGSEAVEGLRTLEMEMASIGYKIDYSRGDYNGKI